LAQKLFVLVKPPCSNEVSARTPGTQTDRQTRDMNDNSLCRHSL